MASNLAMPACGLLLLVARLVLVALPALSILVALSVLSILVALAAFSSREWGRGYRALAGLEHQGAVARVRRSVEDLDGYHVRARLQEDLVLHLPGALRAGHHVPQSVARAVGYEDHVVLGHRRRVSQVDLDVEDAPDCGYGCNTSFPITEGDAPIRGSRRGDREN